MRDVLRSSVNTWDCDLMGHMNVRHYVARANEGLSALLLDLGFGPRERFERSLMVRARDQHLRFTRELRPGMGFTIRAGVVAETPSFITYEEMRTLEDEVSSTVVTELALHDARSASVVPWPPALLEAAAGERCAVPPYAAVRGVSAHPARARVLRDAAVSHGMMPGFLGPVAADDCDAFGVMHEAAVMARLSDGVPHFLRHVYGTSARRPGIGGAALEYRFVFHCWPRLHDLIEVRSGLTAIGSKTLVVTHYVFDIATDQTVAASQSVIAWFDLHARKAVAVPEEVRAHLQGKIIQGLTL